MPLSVYRLRLDLDRPVPESEQGLNRAARKKTSPRVRHTGTSACGCPGSGAWVGDLAREQDEAGGAVPDEVEEGPVSFDREFGFGWT